MNNDIDDYEFGNSMTQKIYIQMVTRRGKKSSTLVKGIPQQFDLKKILRFWKKNFHCLGSVQNEGQQNIDKKDKQKDKQHQKGKEYIKISGDQRKNIQEFLVYMGISLKENIRIQGRQA